MECQSYFGFKLPSVRLSERSNSLTIRFPLSIVLCFDLCSSLLVPCCFACNYAFMFCELLCFFFLFDSTTCWWIKIYIWQKAASPTRHPLRLRMDSSDLDHVHRFIGPTCESALQTASRSVQLLLYSTSVWPTHRHTDHADAIGRIWAMRAMRSHTWSGLVQSFGCGDTLMDTTTLDTSVLFRDVFEIWFSRLGLDSVSSWLRLMTPYVVFPFRRIPFRRMPCKLFFPSFSFLIPFINAIQPFYGCQRNARKIIPLLCRLGWVLRLGSVY